MKYPGKASSILDFLDNPSDRDSMIRSVIGFTNGRGGDLVIGVHDDGDIIGLSQKELNMVQEYLDKTIYESWTPPIIPLIYLRRFGDKVVLVIQVSSGTSKPYYRRSEGLEKGVYIRLGRSTNRANADAIEELKYQSRGLSFDSLPVYHAMRSDLVDASIQEFINKRKAPKDTSLSDTLLKSYKLITEEHGRVYPTSSGILLFGKDPQYHFSEAMVICTRFSGIGGRKAIASMDCTGTLMQQYNQAMDFTMRHLDSSFEIKGIKRDEQLEIPEEAIREALLNMIVHRNYNLPSPSKIAIYDDRIEIFSPGGFSGPIDSNHLLQGISYIRNPAICKVFREYGYMEKLGSGFITIFESYKKRNFKKPEIVEGNNFVKCILSRKSLSKTGSKENDLLDQIEMLVANSEGASISTVMKKLKLSRSTAKRKLSELVKANRLIKQGRGRSVMYLVA